MTAIAKDFIEINLSTDELMLNELERRDGIYSFIFHELEVPRAETPTRCIAPANIIDHNYIKTKTTAGTADEGNINADTVHSNSLPDELKIKTEAVFIQRSQMDDTASNIMTTAAAAATTKTLTYSSSTATTSFISTIPVIRSLTPTTASTSAATTIIVPSLFAASPLTTPPSTTAANDIGGTLPCMSSLSGVSMRSYHEYLKTWHPPPSLVYNNPKLYSYMANCGFRVRVPTPRFSHISAPLVRNRRHALKDTPKYKRMSELFLCAPVADLRALFPHDPDVHAPFAVAAVAATAAAAEDVVATSLELLGNGEIAVELDSDCCGDVAALMTASPTIK
ncbi:PREDICTED: uncharacterized protein LOC108367776 [Rhagoletis zephyria]|uniref:uncharacterized protein LOC108367776 n=1 Tax=Rhagoletis zephyria TaxID=28612 RepID=UPI000811A084|nr:PREDICTED: uncharacterized protein LOC108367776 [Rhagoletis zephyria]